MEVLTYLGLSLIVLWLVAKIISPDRKSFIHLRIPRRKKVAKETWVQLYDTDSLEEAKSIQMHLEEEEIECIIYEQGRRDVHGNPLKGYGISVPRYYVSRAQKFSSALLPK